MKEFKGFRKGINLGGWLSQCDCCTEHYETFITENDIVRLASWGLDHIRLPIDYCLIETDEGEDIESGYQYIDNCIDWCRNHNLNMILDLHKTAGFAFDELESARDLFNDERLQQRFIEIWKKLAARYGKFEDFVAFELLNEVVYYDVSDKWNALIRRVITEIRKIARTVKIIVGGVCYNSAGTVELLEKPYDENIIFTFHCYEPLLFTHQKANWIPEMPPELTARYPDLIGAYQESLKFLKPEHVTLISKLSENLNSEDMASPEFFEIILSRAIKAAEEYSVPLYCGEFGVIDQAPVTDVLNWYRDINSVFEKYNIGRAAWTYKKKDFGFIDERYADVLDELITLL